jgi:outer membrane receptor for ferrienterochelin and colicins
MKYLFIILFLGSSFSIIGQTSKNKVYGTVKDTSGGIAGATVAIPATSWGTTTDANGHFELTLPHGKHKISIRFVGYTAVEKEIAVENAALSLGDILLTLRPINWMLS